MPDLLVRGVSEETKRALALRAAAHSRSMQAEALAIITEAVEPQPAPWFPLLRDALRNVAEDGFAAPERHAARESTIW